LSGEAGLETTLDTAQARIWRRTERVRLIAEREAMPGAARAQASAAICEAFWTRFSPPELGVVGGYWPTRGEFDCRPLMRRLLEAGGVVALPVVAAPRLPLQFRAWTPATPMEAGRWDILHPAEGAPVRPDTLLIPLVGFDGAGHRLGYGGGYYDRTLAALAPRPRAIGFGFELGRLASISPGPRDVAMDWVVTEAGVFEAPITTA
jgi:5-formyltetrahydrofolate cyclo-ligase